MKELTPAIVNKLIEKIEIHTNVKKRSSNNVKVDIFFTAVELFDMPTEQHLIDTTNKANKHNKEKSS